MDRQTYNDIITTYAKDMGFTRAKLSEMFPFSESDDGIEYDIQEYIQQCNDNWNIK